MRPSRTFQHRAQVLLYSALVAFLCYLAAKIGGALIIRSPQTLWPLWPGCAVLVAVLLLSPKKIWPFLIPAGLIGFTLYDLQAGVPLTAIGWLLLTDIVEVGVTAGGISYFLSDAPRLNSLKAFAKYSFFTVFLGPFLTAAVGIWALDGDRWISFRGNFLSEGLAFLTVTPAILGWALPGPAIPRSRRGFRLEAAILFGALIYLSYVMFVVRGGNGQAANPALLYSLVPFLLWSALRFGSMGASTAASIVALLSIWGALHDHGPFRQADPTGRVFSLQLFLWCTVVPFMVLAVLVEERKQQEVILRESEQRFRLMADSAPTLIWMSNAKRQATFFNRGWLEFTGRTMAQELGEGWADGIHPDDVAHIFEVYFPAFDARAKFSVEFRLRRQDGEYRWIVAYGEPRLDSDGVFCGYIGSCIDITERKLTEISLHELTGRLIHAQEEERARIARELHDDISQRMAFLQIGLDQFEQSAQGMTANERLGLQNLVEVASEVSSDLHNMSHRLHPARLDLQGLVAATASYCKELANKHELEVRFVHQDVPTQIPTDISLCLFRIVQESLRNVVKHSMTAEATVEIFGYGDRIELCISDTGAGFRPDSAASKVGLGLISIRERLRLIGGQLTVRSEVSRGTSICVQVPLSAGVPAKAIRARA
jgi:PAS domain S-box-containing protein